MKIKPAAIKPATLPEILRTYRITPKQVKTALKQYGYKPEEIRALTKTKQLRKASKPK